jgi:SAM-dependent methyltransferase
MDWTARFTQQARWTRDLRAYLFDRVGIQASQRVLEVGCGPGVITAEMHKRTHALIYGLDVHLPSLHEARSSDPRSIFTNGNALNLPFTEGVFDVVYCHFLLLWVGDAQQVINEMARVVHPGGAVLALAEPDYGGRIDYPIALAELGRLQGDALRRQGADPLAGRKVTGWFQRAGLTGVESGILGGQWSVIASPESQEMEWQVLAADLKETLAPNQLSDLRRIDAAAWEKGDRVLFVPTFYAWGRKA